MTGYVLEVSEKLKDGKYNEGKVYFTFTFDFKETDLMPMEEQTSDCIGQILFYLVFLAPLLSVILCWRVLKIKIIYRIIFGLMLGLALSFILYSISLAIIFRNGMGPT